MKISLTPDEVRTIVTEFVAERFCGHMDEFSIACSFNREKYDADFCKVEIDVEVEDDDADLA